MEVLCTCGCVDDVMLSHNGANGPESEMLVSSSSPVGAMGDEVAVYDCRLFIMAKMCNFNLNAVNALLLPFFV